jgi:hypothetical protein
VHQQRRSTAGASYLQTKKTIMNRINLAQLSKNFQAWQSCKAENKTEWMDKWEDRINEQLSHLPHGSGIDAGIQFNWEESRPEKLRFTFPFHHMDEHGYYDGWTDHKLIIIPSFFNEFKLTITGRNRNQVKDYLYDLFYNTFEINHVVYHQVA